MRVGPMLCPAALASRPHTRPVCCWPPPPTHPSTPHPFPGSQVLATAGCCPYPHTHTHMQTHTHIHTTSSTPPPPPPWVSGPGHCRSRGRPHERRERAAALRLLCLHTGGWGGHCVPAAVCAMHAAAVCGSQALLRLCPPPPHTHTHHTNTPPCPCAQICASAFGQSVMAGRLEKLTFLRMGDMMVDNWDVSCFIGVVVMMRAP